MICQCIITASFASGRKPTSHGVVRDISFSVARDTPDELYIQAPLEYPRLLQETCFPHVEPERHLLRLLDMYLKLFDPE